MHIRQAFWQLMHVLFALTDVSAWQYLSGNFGEQGLGTAKKLAEVGVSWVWVKGDAGNAKPDICLFRMQQPCNAAKRLGQAENVLQKSSMWFMISYLIGLCQASYNHRNQLQSVACLLLQMEKFLRANQWEPIRLDSGEAATKQIGPQYEYGAKIDPGTGTPEEIEYLHLFVTSTPIAIGTFDWALQFKQQILLFNGL